MRMPARPRTALCAVVATFAVALIGSGCGGTDGAGATTSSDTKEHELVTRWVRQLRAGARSNPDRRFPNPARDELRRRLSRASAHYGFTIVRLSFLHPRQDAPLIVVCAEDRGALTRAVPAILRRLDPLLLAPGGPSYEGLLFEALDANGRPFLVTYAWSRGAWPGGGQWASSPAYLPFAHG